jgi:hypothetical protein
MDAKVSLDKIYKPSEDVVARDVQGEFIIIPIASGIGDSDEEIYSLNETGIDIWNRLDGKKSLKEIENELAKDYETSVEEIEKDVLGIVEELLKKKMLVEV